VGWSCCGLERRVYNPVINSHVVVLIAPTYLARQICLNHDNYHFLEIPQLWAWLHFMPYGRKGGSRNLFYVDERAFGLV